MRTIETDCSRPSTGNLARIAVHGCLATVLYLSFSFTARAMDHIVTALANMTFSPKTLTINAGDTVTFKNGGGFHNVASDPGAVTAFRCANGCDSAGGDGNLSSAAWSATVKFPTAGTAAFHCEAHGAAGGVGMSGTITVKAAAVQKRRNDFNGDGKSDILWRNGTTGANSIWLSANSATKQTVATLADLNWKVVGSGDYNGDGKSDILWRNSSTGANSIWLSANSTTKQAVSTLADLNWKVAGSGDYNGDGKSDILWRNSSTGANSIWRSANSTTKQAVNSVADVAWIVAGAGDYNGDGKSDILWRNGTTGANSIWLSANSATKQAVSTLADTAWKVAGSGDYNGDGKSDILWRNSSTGGDSVWRSANSTTKQAVTMQAIAWSVVGTVE